MRDGFCSSGPHQRTNTPENAAGRFAQLKSRCLVAICMAALWVAMTTPPAYASYATRCAGCHAASASPEVDNLPNGTGSSGSIRAANNRTYLDTKVTAGMGNFATVSDPNGFISLTAAERNSIVAEIGSSNSVAIPVITSTAPPGGNYNNAYSKTVTATSAPNLNGPHLPSAFSSRQQVPSRPACRSTAKPA